MYYKYFFTMIMGLMQCGSYAMQKSFDQATLIDIPEELRCFISTFLVDKNFKSTVKNFVNFAHTNKRIHNDIINSDAISYLIKYYISISGSFEVFNSLERSLKQTKNTFVKYIINHNLDLNIITDESDNSFFLALIHTARRDLFYAALDNLDQIGDPCWSFKQNQDAIPIILHVLDNPILLSKLLQMGLSPNSELIIDNNCLPVLYIAIIRKKPEVIKMLLSFGADACKYVDLEDDGFPMIFSLIERKLTFESIEVLEILLENRADPDVLLNEMSLMREIIAYKPPIKKGRIKLYGFLFKDRYKSQYDLIQEQMIKKLLQYSANIDIISKNKSTPLMTAIVNKKNNIVQLLIDSGANINHQNSQGDTPLMLAIQFKNIQSVKLLLQNNADKTITNNDGKTALNIAKESNLLKAIKLLKSK